MLKFKIITIFVFVFIPLLILNCEGEESMIDISRNSTVEIVGKLGNLESRGTGFFVSDQYVVTCFHVIAISGESINASFSPDIQLDIAQGKKLYINVLKGIQIKTNSGETIGASVVSLPSQIDASPILYDFAILKLSAKPKQLISVLKFVQNDQDLKVGSDVLFSGYPLGAPMMLSHKGMISGIDAKGLLIGIQASINKGNSGGALLALNGDVLGIIDSREGGISKGLQDLSDYINRTASHGNVLVMGVDPLQSIKALIGTLDMYISTGIGYAINIKFLKEYLKKYPNLLT